MAPCSRWPRKNSKHLLLAIEKITVELVEGKRVAREGNLLCRNSCATSVTAPVPFCKPNQIQPARTGEPI
jgi:hypothetical protein